MIFNQLLGSLDPLKIWGLLTHKFAQFLLSLLQFLIDLVKFLLNAVIRFVVLHHFGFVVEEADLGFYANPLLALLMSEGEVRLYMRVRVIFKYIVLLRIFWRGLRKLGVVLTNNDPASGFTRGLFRKDGRMPLL